MAGHRGFPPYEAPRGQVATALRAILGFAAIRVLDGDLLLRAIEVYEVDRLDCREGPA